MTERYWNADPNTIQHSLLDWANNECIDAIEDMITSSDSMALLSRPVDGNVAIYARTCEITGKADKTGNPLRFFSPTYDVFEIITENAVLLSGFSLSLPPQWADEQKKLLRDEVAALSNLSAKINGLIQQISAKNNL